MSIETEIKIAQDYLMARGHDVGNTAPYYDGRGRTSFGVDFDVLVGETILKIDATKGADVIDIVCESGLRFRMLHHQDCCEGVDVEDIIGDLADITGAEILMAEESSNSDDPPMNAESYTWTFYKLATIRGYVTLRWLGTSNGYYSEHVAFECVGFRECD